MVKALKNHCWFSDKDKNPCVMRRKIKNTPENGRDNEDNHKKTTLWKDFRTTWEDEK